MFYRLKFGKTRNRQAFGRIGFNELSLSKRWTAVPKNFWGQAFSASFVASKWGTEKVTND
ncbi:MAG: hypothetical protein COT73_03450 [Bdellovibrio sp. CG10_big_fil_rev_8_21_14_0_10_47_8]|nr:MAG: hypothetical protein COT73_03450 [Bdellovibrio sp. CG10_big_fil_rev_8_21_14_0_10_47_8]